MSAIILDGRRYAKEVLDEVHGTIKHLKGRLVLKILMVGNDPRSEAYVRRKQEAALLIGINCEVVRFNTDATTWNLEKAIRGYGRDGVTDGLIVQLPLPGHIDLAKLADCINPDQDVDCFTPENQGLLMLRRPRFIPATPHGIVELLRRAGYKTSGKQVTIVNDSTIVGRPLMAALLLPGEMGEATVTIAHKMTPDLIPVCYQADILITGVGQPGLITAKHIKPGAVVIDVGTTQVGTKLVGDVDFESVSQVALAITPVPGGVGPMTVAMLLYNVLRAWQLKCCSGRR